jgi:prevent-host-death family protein
MRTIASADAARRLGAVLKQVDEAPVVITRRGRAAAVLMSKRDFDAHAAVIESAAIDGALSYVERSMATKPLDEIKPRNLLMLMRSLTKIL